MAETNPSKFYSHFLYKAIFVSIFLLVVPLFPSEAPNFINSTINTTSWELLQLVFVGIAVSYGLFSKRTNEDDEKEEVKSDNAHSYVTRLLQVSSVFDDDDDDDDDESERRRQENNNSNKVETWSSQYYRGEPIVVVAKETVASDDATIEKPRVSESMLISRSSNSRKSPQEENIVLRSPIPWRSRSGRMELKQTPSQSQSQSQSQEENIHSSSSSSDIKQSLSFRYHQSSTNPLSSEIQLQDFGRKNNSPIPPPPPPPPPPAQQKLNYYYRQSRMKKEFTRSLTNEDLQKQKRARMRSGSDRFTSSSSSSGGSKSFRIPRETEYDEYLSHDKEIESFIQRRGSQKEDLNTETEPPIEMMIKDSEESQEDEDEDDELVELASKNNVDDHGPDVDKKADEFIAKFREQIRLQRIASIRRSTPKT